MSNNIDLPYLLDVDHFQSRKMWRIATFLLLFSVLGVTEKLKIHQIIASFCYQNQFNDIVMIDFDANEVFNLFKGQYDLQIKVYNQPNMSTQTSFIIATISKKPIFDLLTILQNHPVQNSLIIVPNTLIEKLTNILSSFNSDLSFYTLEEQKDKKYQWNHIISLQNKKTILKQKLDFDQNGKLIQIQDLQGIELKTITLPITPWIDFDNCTSKINCQHHGILVDLVNSWTKPLNFTLVVHKDPTDDWGIYPINGKISLTDKKGNISIKYNTH